MSDADAPRDNLRGGAWLIADMSLNIWALSIVKAIGLDYPPQQIVFLRALVGLVLILPWIVHRRAAFRALPDLPLHLLRVVLSVVTLTGSFFAIARVPLALFTGANFLRPVVVMVMAALLLGERIGRARWGAALVALIGIAIAVRPDEGGDMAGLLALAIVILCGSGATIATRRLRSAPPVVMMAFYTGGLTLATALPALWAWVPVTGGALLPLLLIGVFAQSAQLCFLNAHYHGEAGFLSVLSYISLPLSVTVGWAVFGEVPGPAFFAGAALVVGAALWVTTRAR